MDASIETYSPDDSSTEVMALKIEVNSFFQIPSLQIVGLPNVEIHEAKERIRSAILASEFEFPRRRILVNLIPAHLKKRGTGWDLGIALQIIATHAELKSQKPLKVVAWGELGLFGEVRSAGKTLRAYQTAISIQADVLILSAEDRDAFENCRALNPISGHKMRVIFGTSLRNTYFELTTNQSDIEMKTDANLRDEPRSAVGLLPLTEWWRDLVGISISGGHSVMLLGSKGSGKSSLIRWFEALQRPAHLNTRISNLMRGELREPHLLKSKTALHESAYPCRRPSSLIRPASLVGKLDHNHWIPGELAVCDGGYLISDEFLEWPRDSREILRSPLENFYVQIERGAQSFRYQTRFTWLSTANLCPCGEWTPTRSERCRCLQHQRKQYLERLSGPILDRIGIVQIMDSSRKDPPYSPSVDFEWLNRKITETQERLLQKSAHLPAHIPDYELYRILGDCEVFQAFANENPDLSHRHLHQRGRVALSVQAWHGRKTLTELDFQIAKALFSDPFETC